MNNKLIHTQPFLKGGFDFAKARALAVNFIHFTDAAQAVNAVFDHMDAVNLMKTFTVLPPAPIASHYAAQPRVYSAQELSDLMGALVAECFPVEHTDDYPTHWFGFTEFERKAQGLGFKRLGNGYFSIAFSHPSLPNKVLKVGFKKEDSAAAYIGFCRLHAGCEGIPAIHEVNRYERCYTVVLDQYETFNRWGEHAGLEDEAFGALRLAVEFGKGTLESGTRSHIARYSATPEWADEYCAYVERLIETGLKVNAFFKGLAEFDCHEGNVMVHGDKLMLTDPVSFTKNIKGWDAMTVEGLSDQQREAAKELARKKRNRRVNHKCNFAERRHDRKVKAQVKKRRAAQDMRKRIEWDNLNHLMDIDMVPPQVRWANEMQRLQMIARDMRHHDNIAMLAGRTMMADQLVQGFLMG